MNFFQKYGIGQVVIVCLVCCFTSACATKLEDQTSQLEHEKSRTFWNRLFSLLLEPTSLSSKNNKKEFFSLSGHQVALLSSTFIFTDLIHNY